MRGQTLIEVLVALSIIAIVATMVGTTITTGLNNAQFAKTKTLATKYSQEGLEAIHELRGNNYSQFKNYSGSYCLGALPPTLSSRPSSCTTPNVGTFIRTVDIDQSPGCGANLAKVTVMVSWSDGKCPATNLYCHVISQSSCLSTVNPIQGP